VAGGGGDSIPAVSKSKRGRGVEGRRRLGGGNEEGGALVRFGYSRTEESGRQ
jgi:hypothetical protein